MNHHQFEMDILIKSHMLYLQTEHPNVYTNIIDKGIPAYTQTFSQQILAIKHQVKVDGLSTISVAACYKAINQQIFYVPSIVR